MATAQGKNRRSIQETSVGAKKLASRIKEPQRRRPRTAHEAFLMRIPEFGHKKAAHDPGKRTGIIGPVGVDIEWCNPGNIGKILHSVDFDGGVDGPIIHLKIDEGGIGVRIELVEISPAAIPSDAKSDFSLPTLREQKSPSAPVRFVSGHENKIFYQRLEFQDGAVEEIWRFEGWVGWKDRLGNLMVFEAFATPEMGPDPAFFNAKRPPGLDWWEKDFFIAPAKNAKKDPYSYYATELSDRKTGNVARAWLDPVTGIPVAAQRGGLAFIYSFGHSITIPPRPPELVEQQKARVKVNSFIQKMRERRKP